jgi:hypothetical protein
MHLPCLPSASMEAGLLPSISLPCQLIKFGRIALYLLICIHCHQSELRFWCNFDSQVHGALHQLETNSEQGHSPLTGLPPLLLV